MISSRRTLTLLATALVVVFSCQADQTKTDAKSGTGMGKDKMAFVITSTAFKHEGMIPQQYTCDGADISPQLAWSGGPQGVQSFALICDDPDAPVGDWVHWILYNIPPDVHELKEKIANDPMLANGAKHGFNDFRRFGYGGPCPPGGTHRYFFKLYALDSTLTLPAKATKQDVLTAMKGHILAQAELMGKYSRK
jgi:Raf kinase inhibitor-like YbhB/YbcL family protein